MTYYEYQSEDTIHILGSLIISATFIMTTIT